MVGLGMAAPSIAKAISKQVSFQGMDRSVWLVGGIILAVFIGFIVTPYLGVPLAVVAFVGGSLALFVLPLANRRTNAKAILQGVDWTLLLFFIGLFIVLKGVETSGLLQEMEDAFQSVSDGGLSTIPGLSFFTAILSNLISNVPAVMLLAPFVESVGETSLWLALAASSTLAGNATILGAAANVIVAENGEKLGVQHALLEVPQGGASDNHRHLDHLGRSSSSCWPSDALATVLPSWIRFKKRGRIASDKVRPMNKKVLIVVLVVGLLLVTGLLVGPLLQRGREQGADRQPEPVPDQEPLQDQAGHPS